MIEQPKSLTKAQDIIEQFAPNPNYAKKYRGWERDYLPPLCEHLADASPDTALDIGPGWGTMAVWLARRGCGVTVMDFRPPGYYLTEALCLEHGIIYAQADIERTHLGERYDLVLMTQVLPHLCWRADQAVVNAAAMLTKDGTFLCSSLNKAGYKDKPVPFANWKDVPRLDEGPEPEESVKCLYYESDLHELLELSFKAVRIWQPEGCSTMIAECWYPRQEGA